MAVVAYYILTLIDNNLAKSIPIIVLFSFASGYMTDIMLT